MSADREEKKLDAIGHKLGKKAIKLITEKQPEKDGAWVKCGNKRMALVVTVPDIVQEHLGATSATDYFILRGNEMTCEDGKHRISVVLVRTEELMPQGMQILDQLMATIQSQLPEIGDGPEETGDDQEKITCKTQ
jgi:hypothetical protein